ncbi:hypothetical protein C6P46_004883 [Rhodotorula mucilaginosa]|uniref:Uncharacterized protein n=1 Tax=Rhodotorula mucilaginosa TaxID=5537 RepID=A0A9P6W9C0_RHOMI|nr:hypothetical protein C6P46_004883 [Rhodotorula mucilaginosa]
MAQTDGPEEDGMSAVAPTEAAVKLTQTLSPAPSVETQPAESTNAAAAVDAASETHISNTDHWPHCKCLDLQKELRARMRETQSRALKAEAKVEPLERNLTALHQKGAAHQAAAATAKDIADGTRHIVAKINLLQRDLDILTEQHRTHCEEFQQARG